MLRTLYVLSIWCSAVTAMVGTCSAQTSTREGTLTIGSTVLRLGDIKARVIPELQRQFTVQPTAAAESAGGAWLIKGKKESAENVYASVTFDDKGILIAATKYWLPESRVYRSEDVFTAIYGVVERFAKLGDHVCTIGADEHHSPGPPGPMEIKDVFVRCGAELLNLALVRQSDSVSVDVSEILIADDPKLR